jgi:hypothetical protein
LCHEGSGRFGLEYLIDYSRIKKEFNFQHRDLREGYLDLIKVVRREAVLTEIKG